MNSTSADTAIPGTTVKLEEDRPSAIRAGLQELGGGFFDLIAFWHTFRALWKQPGLAVNDPENRLKIAPLPFAAQAAVLLYLIMSSAGWFTDTFLDVPNLGKVGYRATMKRLDANLAAARTAKEKAMAEQELRHYELDIKAGDLATSVSQGATAISYLTGAWFFAWYLRRWRGKYPRLALADGAFLYEVTARSFLPALVMMLMISAYLLCDRLMPDIAGSKLKLMVCGAELFVYSLSCVWCMVVYVIACRNLVTMFDIPRYTKRKDEGDNKVHHAIAWGFVLASVIIGAIPTVVLSVVRDLYMLVRHG